MAALVLLAGCTGDLQVHDQPDSCPDDACSTAGSDASTASGGTLRSDSGTRFGRDFPSGPACADGIDNDGDGATDLNDAGCLAALDDSESDRRTSDTGTASNTDGEAMTFQTVYRVNSGGPELSGSPSWGADNDSSRSPHVAGAGQQFGGRDSDDPSITVDDSVGEAVPADLFAKTRWDGEGASGGSGEMTYGFDVGAGEHRVDIFFCETWEGATEVGTRVFDVEINGNTVLQDLDMYAEKGGFTGFVRTFEVETSADDEEIEVVFLHESNNPMVAGLEVRSKR